MAAPWSRKRRLANGDGNIDSNEFLAVPVASIRDSNADGVLDNLDPNIGFVVQNAQPSSGSGMTITWYLYREILSSDVQRFAPPQLDEFVGRTGDCG